MRDKLRKKYQHGINKLVKEVNKSIEEDWLWNGRFVFHIVCNKFEKFEDGSGGMLYIVLRGYDKKTKFYHDYIIDYAPYLTGCKNHLWSIVNHFITEDTDTWKYGNDPYKEKKVDYTKIKINDEIWKV